MSQYTCDQFCRITSFAKATQRTASPTSCLNQFHLQQVPQGLVQVKFLISPRMEILHLRTILVTLLWTCSKISVPFLYWGSPNWTLCPEQSHQWQTEGNNHLPQPSGYTLANTTQDAADLLCCKGRLLTCVQFVHQDLQGLFRKPACIVAWGYSTPDAGLCLC